MGIAVSKASLQGLGVSRLETYQTLSVVEYEVAFKGLIRNTQKRLLYREDNTFRKASRLRVQHIHMLVFVVVVVVVLFCFVCGATAPQWARATSSTRFPDHKQRRTTVGRTPLDE